MSENHHGSIFWTSRHCDEHHLEVLSTTNTVILRYRKSAGGEYRRTYIPREVMGEVMQAFERALPTPPALDLPEPMPTLFADAVPPSPPGRGAGGEG